MDCYYQSYQIRDKNFYIPLARTYEFIKATFVRLRDKAANRTYGLQTIYCTLYLNQ